MKPTKAQRAAVFAMFDGRCAYCGVELGVRWHVDHKDPVIRNTYLRQPNTRPACRPENHRLDNLFPACAPCNIDKGSFCVEGYREWIMAHLSGLKRQSNFRSVLRHRVIAETQQPIVFYFERIANERGPQQEQPKQAPQGSGEASDGALAREPAEAKAAARIS